MQKIKQFFDRHQTIQQLLVGVVIIVITYLFGELYKLPWWFIWLTVLFAVALGLWIWNQITEKSKKRISKLSEEEIEQTVQDWILDTPGVSCEKQKVKETDEEFFIFTITLTDPDQPKPAKFHVIQKRSTPKQIDIVLWGDLKLENVQADVRDKIKRKISLELARMGCEFTYGNDKDALGKLVVAEPLVIDDSLTVYHFRQKLLSVIRATILIQIIREESFIEAGIKSPPQI